MKENAIIINIARGQIINQDDLIDLKRVYATGYSNGGFFSYFLACNTDNVLAAIGDVAGTMLVDTYNTCNQEYNTPGFHSLLIKWYDSNKSIC